MVKSKLLINDRNRLRFLVAIAGLAILSALVFGFFSPKLGNITSGQSRTAFPEFKFTQNVVYGDTVTSKLVIGQKGDSPIEADWYLAANPLNRSCPNKAYLEQDHYKVSSIAADKTEPINVSNHNQAVRYCILAVPDEEDTYNHRIAHYQVSVPTMTISQTGQTVTVESKINNSRISHPAHGSMYKYYQKDGAFTSTECKKGDEKFDNYASYKSLTSNPATITLSHTSGSKYLCIRGEYKTNNNSGDIYVYKTRTVSLDSPTINLNRESSNISGKANDLIVGSSNQTVSDWQYIYGANITNCDENAFEGHVVGSGNPNNGEGVGSKLNITTTKPAVTADTRVCFKAKNTDSVWGYSSFYSSLIADGDLIDITVEQIPHIAGNVVDGTRLNYTKSSLSSNNIQFRFSLNSNDTTCADSTVDYSAEDNPFTNRVKRIWPNAVNGSYLCVNAYVNTANAYVKVKLDLQGPTIVATKTAAVSPLTINVSSSDDDIQSNSFSYQYRLSDNQLLTNTNQCNNQITGWQTGNSITQPTDVTNEVTIICLRARDKSGNWSYLGQVIDQISLGQGQQTQRPLQISVSRSGNVISYSSNKTNTSWSYKLASNYTNDSQCQTATGWSTGKVGLNHSRTIYCVRGASGNMTDYSLFDNTEAASSEYTLSISKDGNRIILTTSPQLNSVSWSSFGPFSTAITDQQCSRQTYQTGVLLETITSSSQNGWYCYRATLPNGQYAYKAVRNSYKINLRPKIQVSQNQNEIVYTANKAIKQWRHVGPLATKPVSCHQIVAKNIGQISRLTDQSMTGWYCFMGTDHSGRFDKPAEAIYLAYQPAAVNPELSYVQTEANIIVVVTNKTGDINWLYHLSDDQSCNSSNSTRTYYTGRRLIIAKNENDSGKWLCVSATDSDNKSTQEVTYRMPAVDPQINFSVNGNILITTVNNASTTTWRYKLAADLEACYQLDNGWSTINVDNQSTLKINLDNAKSEEFICVRAHVGNNIWLGNQHLVVKSDQTDNKQDQTPTAPKIIISQADNKLIGSTADNSPAKWKILIYNTDPIRCNDQNKYFGSDKVVESNTVKLSQKSVGQYFCFKATNSAGSSYQVYNVVEVNQPPVKKQSTTQKKKTTKTTKKANEADKKSNQEQKKETDKTEDDKKAEQTEKTNQTETSKTETKDAKDDPDETDGGLWSRDNLIWWMIAACGLIIIGIIAIEFMSASNKKQLDEADDEDEMMSGKDNEEDETTVNDSQIKADEDQVDQTTVNDNEVKADEDNGAVEDQAAVGNLVDQTTVNDNEVKDAEEVKTDKPAENDKDVTGDKKAETTDKTDKE